MCKMFESSTSSSAKVSCTGSMKVRHDIENHKLVNEVQMDETDVYVSKTFNRLNNGLNMIILHDFFHNKPQTM